MIKNASVADASRILEMMRELNVSRDSGKAGFIEYAMPDLAGVTARIEDNPFFFVFEKAGEIIGFSSAYAGKDLKRLGLWEDEVVKHISLQGRNFLYWDQLGVRADFQGSIVASRLMDAFLHDQNLRDYSEIWATICHSPKNARAIRLAESRGLSLRREISACRGLSFGIYSRAI